MFALLDLNQRSRRGRKFAPSVRAALRAFDIRFVEGREVDESSQNIDCVIAAGGDGTIVRCIPIAIARGVPLGIIPLGTFNELARTLDIPLEVERAVQTIAGGARRTIDVGRVNGCYFTSEASIGISSRLTHLQTTDVKQRFGVFGVIGTMFAAYRHARPINCVVSYDETNESFRTVQLTIANSNRFGGIVNVLDAAIDDGWLDLYSVEINSFLEALPVTRALLSRRRERVPGLRTIRSHRFAVETKHSHRIVADGEPAGTTPAVFDLLPKALSVYVRE